VLLPLVENREALCIAVPLGARRLHVFEGVGDHGRLFFLLLDRRLFCPLRLSLDRESVLESHLLEPLDGGHGRWRQVVQKINCLCHYHGLFLAFW